MRVITVNIGQTNIEFDNCMWTGYESIYVNGKLVSKKFSVFGQDHSFDVAENGTWARYLLTVRFGLTGIKTDLFRNGVPIIESGGIGLKVGLPAVAAEVGTRSTSEQEYV